MKHFSNIFYSFKLFNQLTNPVIFNTKSLNFPYLYFCCYLSRKKSWNDKNIDFADLSQLNENTEIAKKKEKTPEEPKVYLRNEKGRLLGIMTVLEAEKLAEKYKKILIKIEGATRKIPTMKFYDARSIQDETNRNILSDGSQKQKSFSPKVVQFTSKVSENDLQVKINQVKKILNKKQETIIRVISNKDELKRLVN